MFIEISLCVELMAAKATAKDMNMLGMKAIPPRRGTAFLCTLRALGMS